MILQLRSTLGGYPFILGRPWLANANAHIGYRGGNTNIYHDKHTKHHTLFPPSKPNTNHENTIWIENEEVDEESIQLVFSINTTLCLKDDTKNNIINGFLSNPSTSSDFNAQLSNTIMYTNQEDIT